MSKFDDAIRFSIAAHEGMRRKADDTVYIVHPLEVACIAASLTKDEDILCAAVLHDVVEDTSHTLEELREAFGERVAELVTSESEIKRPDQPADETWRLRKEESLAQLTTTTDEAVRILWLADKLSNIRSLQRVQAREGEAMWRYFNQKDPAQHEWYYREIANATKSLADSYAWQEYTRLIDIVFGEERA